MPDVPGDTSTTSTLTVGGSTTGTLEVMGDHDWYRITLTAGQTISITMNGTGAGPLEDPYLQILNASGTALGYNDDGGAGRNALLTFRAPSSGTYYIDAAAWQPDSPIEDYTGTGDFTLSVTTWNPPPVWTNDQIATQLSTGYWDGSGHHFNVSQGGSISVNLTALTAAGQNLARSALQLWDDVIGVTFNEVSTGGQITFDDNEEGASTSSSFSGGITTSAHVNVSTDWLADYGTTIDSYAFQTYVHEIGHALGLGHAGNYNETADYPFDALFENDAWSASVMSYFSPSENSYYSSRGFTSAYSVTPMVADIIAMGQLYGLSTTTRTGNTTYGFNSTAGRAVFDASQNPGVAYTIFDNGGTDTLDYSGFSTTQLIDLNPETFFNVGGRTGTVSIARGTVIENAIGGSGSDTIIGNAANNTLTGNAGNDTLSGNAGDDILTGGSSSDSLTGGAGSDVFFDTTSGLNGDTIVDFTSVDRIVFTNATLGAFTFSLAGSTLSYTGGSLTFSGGLSGSFAATAAASGGVQLSLVPVAGAADALHDFNGDGRSDILWRSSTGQLSDWLGTASGGFTPNDGNAFANVPTSWSVTGTGDFNGDGRDDILWRSNTGQLSNWLGKANGGFTSNDANALTGVPTSWSVVGTGDFNGDGRDDILWRSNSGQLSDWLGTASGGFTPNDGNAFSNVPTSWNVVGTGDFNGDGRDDILWRSNTGQLSDWLGTSSGGFTSNDANAFTGAPTSWNVVGTGDFNGDGRDDILWRSNSGQLSNWLGTASGGFTPNDGNALANVPTSWHVADVGDYNGDGRDDILWRSDSGQLSDWLGTASGGFIPNDANAATGVPTNWQVQSPDSLWV